MAVAHLVHYYSNTKVYVGISIFGLVSHFRSHLQDMCHEDAYHYASNQIRCFSRHQFIHVILLHGAVISHFMPPSVQTLCYIFEYQKEHQRMEWSEKHRHQRQQRQQEYSQLEGEALDAKVLCRHCL